MDIILYFIILPPSFCIIIAHFCPQCKYFFRIRFFEAGRTDSSTPLCSARNVTERQGIRPLQDTLAQDDMVLEGNGASSTPPPAKIGNVFGSRFKKKAEIAGGVILILLGLKILLEHLGVIGLYKNGTV